MILPGGRRRLSWASVTGAKNSDGLDCLDAAQGRLQGVTPPGTRKPARVQKLSSVRIEESEVEQGGPGCMSFLDHCGSAEYYLQHCRAHLWLN
jgi:hypothetical protein